MTPRLSLLALLPGVLLLGACSGTVNRGVESVHQPVVRHTDYVFDVPNEGGSISTIERGRLAGWLASLNLGFGDSVAVDDGSYGSRARDQVAALAARYGLLLAERVPITAGQAEPGTIRVVVSRMVAAVPGCPDYSRMGQPDFEAQTSSNFGCALNANLAAMVARPEDLVRGQAAVGASDVAVSNKAIGTMRAAPNTGAGGLRGESTGGK